MNDRALRESILLQARQKSKLLDSLIEIERKKIRLEETKHKKGELKMPDLKEVLGAYPESIEIKEDIMLSSFGDNPPSDLSYNLV